MTLKKILGIIVFALLFVLIIGASVYIYGWRVTLLSIFCSDVIVGFVLFGSWLICS